MTNSRLIERLRRTDWDFVGKYSESPFSAIHWYPARFVSQLPAAFIGLLTDPGEMVLDPFVGSGTTLVEAQRLGRYSVGIDLNPISCIVAKAKTANVSAERIVRVVSRMKAEAEDLLRGQLRTRSRRLAEVEIPETVQAEKWYTKRVREDLARLWRLVRSYQRVRRTMAEAAFSAILLRVCRETRHWGYVCDNSTPRGNREGDVLREYTRVLDRLVVAYEERDAERVARAGKVGSIEEAVVSCADVREALSTIDEASVDLVVTSPPYFGVSDYVKAQRLTMEWFGLAIEPYRLREIGARSKRHRRAAYDEYLGELAMVFRQVRRCLRREACCVVVVGESSTRASVLAGMKEAVRDCGFEVELDLRRNVSSQRKQAPSIRGEHLLVLSR